MMRIPRKVIFSVVAMAALVLLLLYIQGSLRTGRTPPGTVPAGGEMPAAGKTATVEKKEIEDYLEWSGTVRSRKVAQVSPKVMAHILTIPVSPGDAVKANDVVATLDSRDLQAKVDQARSGLAAAEAQAAQAKAAYERMKSLFDKEAATQQQLEGAEAQAKATEAQVQQAKDAVKEAEVFLDEAQVKAPFDGVVVEKVAEPGSLAVPGRPIVVIQDPQRMRLEVQVPESCARKASVGMDVRVRIDGLEKEVGAKVDEVQPTADPQSRTFVIKAALPEMEDLRAGMFGRLIQDCGKKTVLLLPAAAVQRIGQIESVRVKGEKGTIRQQHIKTGKRYGEDLEVLSGLDEGDVVIIPE